MAVRYIPLHEDFSRTLAAELLARHPDPLLLSKVTLFLPSRRACEAVRSAFLHVSGGRPLILPFMQPLGGVDEALLLRRLAPLPDLAAPVPDARRIFLLTRLIVKYQAQAYGEAAPNDQAIRLAKDLIAFLDEVEREELSLDGLHALVPEEVAAHWQKTLQFLLILKDHLPPEAVSKVRHRNRMLRALAEAWEKHPPEHPVIAAGTTGSNPAVAALLKVIHGLPQGEIILPGFDLSLGEDAWAALPETHPQYGLKRLMEGLEMHIANVAVIPGHPSDGARNGGVACSLSLCNKSQDLLPLKGEG